MNVRIKRIKKLTLVCPGKAFTVAIDSSEQLRAKKFKMSFLGFMKFKRVIVAVLLIVSSLGQDKSDEIKKIDERLEELKLIWKQEQGVINGFTKNRTVPVKEGSKEYYACLEASKRIKLAETEASKLKEQKALAEKQVIVGNESIAGMNEDPGKVKTLTWKVTSAPYGAYFFEKGHKIDQIKNDPIAYKREIHGLKVKDLFVGMPYSQAGKPIEEICLKSNVKVEPNWVLGRIVEKMNSGWMVSYRFVSPEAFGKGVLQNVFEVNLLDLKLDDSGEVTDIIYKSSLFKTGESSLEEFVKACEDNYGISLESNFAADMVAGVREVSYESKLKSGHKIRLAMSSDGQALEIGSTKINETLELRLTKDVSAEALKNQFDE